MIATALRRTFLPSQAYKTRFLSYQIAKFARHPVTLQFARTHPFLPTRNIQTLPEQTPQEKKALDASSSVKPKNPGHADGVLAATVTSQALPEKLEPRLSITFTCTVPDCSERSTHTFTKRSYEQGIVIVQCPKCKNRHLIADNLGWFKESTGEGKMRNIEDILRQKGEKVQRGRLHADGDIEFTE